MAHADGEVSIPRHHIGALDGLRGAAILAVMIYHFTGGYHGTNKAFVAWGRVADLGWMGVDLFFVLSGFLITGILYDTAHTENRVKNFYARRALRIFPLFYGVLAVLLLATPVLHLRWQWGRVLDFVYLSNMGSLLSPHVAPLSPLISINHFWSLAVEEQFYLLWPFAVWFIRDRRKLLAVTFCILLASPILRLSLALYGVPFDLLSRMLMTRADSLLFGGAVALTVRGPHQDRFPAWSLLSGSTVALLFLRSALLHPDEHPYVMSFAYSLIALAAACLTYQAYRNQPSIDAIFSHRALRFFGKYSYGLYLFHGLIFVALRHTATQLAGHGLSSSFVQSLMLLVGFGGSLAVAMVSFRFFEEPILRLKHRFP